MDKQDVYHYYHQNEHGDTELITGADGKIQNAYSYDAFGNIRTSQELIENRYTYYGEQYDKISEQYYLRARFYNPAIARFTQEDEYRGDGLNLYAYCANNPVMYVDPSGYSDKPCTGKNRMMMLQIIMADLRMEHEIMRERVRLLEILY